MCSRPYFQEECHNISVVGEKQCKKDFADVNKHMDLVSVENRGDYGDDI